VRGGYTQDDVTNLARLLTGWTTARQGNGSAAGELRTDEFRFDPRLSDGAPLEVAGVSYRACDASDRYERARFSLETLAAHPSTARFISTRLVEHYLVVPAPDAIVDDLSRVYLESGGDLRDVLAALAHRPELFERDRAPRLAHPLQFALRLCRATGHLNPWGVGDYLQRSGVGLFDRSTPDGYPEEDSAYMDSNAVLQRWRAGQDMSWPLTELVPGPWRWGDVSKDEAVAREWAQRVVDCIAVRLTGSVLGSASNTAAMNLLLSDQASMHDRVQSVAPFIAQLPEINLR